MLSIDELVRGRYFDREIIILCVRWYLRYKLSFRDLVEMAERGLSLAHTTIMRWIPRYAPAFEKRGTASPAKQAGRGGSMKPHMRKKWECASPTPSDGERT
jgi:transposase-like protein